MARQFIVKISLKCIINYFMIILLKKLIQVFELFLSVLILYCIVRSLKLAIQFNNFSHIKNYVLARIIIIIT